MATSADPTSQAAALQPTLQAAVKNLLFHLYVLLAARDLDPADVEDELRRRAGRTATELREASG